jgi:hypothetical protein
MSEGYPIPFVGGILGGKTLEVSELRLRYRVAVPPPPETVKMLDEDVPPVGGYIAFDEYELVWRQEGPNTRKAFYRLIEN